MRTSAPSAIGGRRLWNSRCRAQTIWIRIACSAPRMSRRVKMLTDRDAADSLSVHFGAYLLKAFK